jgi:hypothetical protein
MLMSAPSLPPGLVGRPWRPVGPIDRPGRWLQVGQIDWPHRALVALAMALSLSLLRAEKQIDIRALIG